MDAEGNVFLAGEATDEVKFGNTTLQSGGGLVDRGYGVATDAAGNCYVTGHYQSTDAEFSGTKLPDRGDYDIFVAKYDRAGKLAWIQTAGGKGYDYGHAIAVDGKGDLIVSGAMGGSGVWRRENPERTRQPHLLREVSSRRQTKPRPAKRAAPVTASRSMARATASSPTCMSRSSTKRERFADSFGGTAKFGDATITSDGSNDLYGAKLKAK